MTKPESSSAAHTLCCNLLLLNIRIGLAGFVILYNSLDQLLHHSSYSYGIFLSASDQPFYEPIIWAMKPYKGTITDCVLNNGIGGFYCCNDTIPSNIIECDINKRNKYHETEKPLMLIEYLIQLFSMQGQTILDFTMGSGTTGVACKNLNRKFIGIELDEKYFEIARKRISK